MKLWDSVGLRGLHTVVALLDVKSGALAQVWTVSDNAAGEYVQRSPIMHAHRVATPTLNICGELDRCTPPEEATQFHNALLQHGAKSVLLVYPGEGHGVRKFPAAIDCAARVVDWFEQHLRGR